MARYQIHSGALGKLAGYVYEAASADDACDLFWNDDAAFEEYAALLRAKQPSMTGDSITATAVLFP